MSVKILKRQKLKSLKLNSLAILKNQTWNSLLQENKTKLCIIHWILVLIFVQRRDVFLNKVWCVLSYCFHLLKNFQIKETLLTDLLARLITHRKNVHQYNIYFNFLFGWVSSDIYESIKPIIMVLNIKSEDH